MYREDQGHFIEDVCRKLKAHVGTLYRVAERPLQLWAQNYFFFEASADNKHLMRDGRALAAKNKLVLKVPFPDNNCEDEEDEDELSPEIEAQMKLDSLPHLATGWAFVEIMEVTGYFMRYYEGGDLFRIILNDKESNSEFLRWLREVLIGLAAVHRMGYVHGNVKAENVLLSRDSVRDEREDMVVRAYLGGFGNIRPLEAAGKVHRKGLGRFSKPILPPELFGDGPEYEYDEAVDIWMFGVLCFQALTRKLPFSCDDGYEEQVLGVNLSVDLTAREDITTTMREAILEMLNPDPVRRPSADMLLERGIFGDQDQSDEDLQDYGMPARMDSGVSSTPNILL